MDVASVTLEEVLKAAQIRAASLVPETSGYLTLAIADASARLPFRLEDHMVSLSTEGSVKVMRGTDVVAPAESAATIRDMLERLLSRSVGSMQGLSQAARERDEAPEGVVAVIADLEAALVPVNRSAARRALARLARETARARDRGKLERLGTRRERMARSDAPPPRPEEKAKRRAPAPQEIERAAPRPATAPAPHHAPPPAREVHDTPEEAIDVSFTEEPSPVEPIAEPTEPTPTLIATTLGEVEGLLLDRPHDAKPPEPVDAPVEGERRRSRRREARIELEEKRSVDDLLQSFSVSGLDADGSMTTTRKSLKVLADLDVTPPPPPMSVLSAVTEPAPQPKPRTISVEIRPAQPPAPRRFTVGPREIAIVAVGLLLAGLLGHYVPAWFASSEGARGDASHAESNY